MGPKVVMSKSNVSAAKHNERAITSTSLDTTTVFHPRLNGRFVEIMHCLRKKTHKTSQGNEFIGKSFGNRYMINPPQFRIARQ